MAPSVESGLDVLAGERFRRLRGRRLGLLSHPASIDRELRHALPLLREAGADLRVLFGPEHGFSGVAQDMQPVAGERRGAVPTVSLYGATEETLAPAREVLADIEVLLVDLQDVGSRYYTFAASARYCLRACRDAGVRLIVLDRPNPLGGVVMEGPCLRPEMRSFVGAFAVPVRHGLTIGELLRLAAQEERCEDALEVVPMRGWRRRMWFDETGLPWVLPSPNMPTLDTAVVYPGACLFEATNLSEGRGTTRPFELIGAPWLDGERLAESMNARALPGVRYRPVEFSPAFHKHAGAICRGVQVHVTDRSAFEPFLAGLFLLAQARRQLPEKFAWRERPYEFVADRPAMDLLCGSERERLAIERGADLSALAVEWRGECHEFARRRRECLLYPEDEP